MRIYMFQIQLRWKMLLPDPYKALDSNYRCVYYPQFFVAGKACQSPLQKGYDVSNLSLHKPALQ